VRQVVAPLETDREISPDLTAVRSLIQQNRFSALL
jgi:histidine ammonia-lyase